MESERQQEMKFKAGDKVRVIKSVWDDGNEIDWIYNIGFIKTESPDPRRPNVEAWFVEFPAFKGKINTYDFYVDELELISD